MCLQWLASMSQSSEREHFQHQVAQKWCKVSKFVSMLMWYAINVIFTCPHKRYLMFKKILDVQKLHKKELMRCLALLVQGDWKPA